MTAKRMSARVVALGFAVLAPALSAACTSHQPVASMASAAAPISDYDRMNDVMKDFNEQLNKIKARSKAEMEAARAEQRARFTAHPEQLKDPKRCDFGELGKDWAEQYRKSVACQDVSGITAENERIRAAADALRCVDAATCRAYAELHAARDALQRTSDELDAQNKAEWDKARSDLEAYLKAEYDKRIKEGDDEALRERLSIERIFRDADRERRLQNLRDEFQQEDQQRRIDAEDQEEEDEEEEDHLMRRTDRARY